MDVELHLMISPSRAELFGNTGSLDIHNWFNKRYIIRNRVIFFVGIVIGISRPKRSQYQFVVYNEWRRKHAL